MKREKTTFILECIKEILLCVFIITITICAIKITVTYCKPEDPERVMLDKDLTRMQIRSFEWDENHRDFYYGQE